MSPPIVILNFIADIVFMLAIARLMGVFFEERRTSFPVMAVSYLLYLVLATVINVMYDTLPDHMGLVLHMIVIPLALFIISLNYQSSVLKRLVATVSHYVLFLAAVMCMATLVYSFLAPLLSNANDDLIEAGAYIAASLLFYIVAHLFRRFKGIKKRGLPMPLFWFFALAVPGTLLFAVFFSALDLPGILCQLIFQFFIFMAMLLILYMYDALAAAYEDKLKSELHSQEKEYYLSQCRLMQQSLESMKSYRHDMKFHLAALKEYTADNKSAADYLNGLLGDIDVSDIYSDTGNIAFDSIINFKLKNAKEDNIKPDIKIFVPSVLNIEIADIVTIIGNLLDNALDAMAKVEEKIIKLHIEFSQGKLFVKMENTFDGRVKYTVDKAGEEKSITTRKDSDEHGHGLKNIRKSVEKYNGCIDIANTDTIFSVGLLLYAEKRMV